MNKRVSPNRAFTYVEVLVAIVLVMVALVPVFSLFISTTSDISNTIDEVLATSYANELLDAVISCDYDEIPMNVTFSDADTMSSNAFFGRLLTNLSPMRPGFRRFIEIGTVQAAFASGVSGLNPTEQEKFDRIKTFKVVNVSLRFNAGQRPRELKIGTLITRD